MKKLEIVAALGAYRRPGSPNYGHHFQMLPAAIVQKRNVRPLLSILSDEGLPERVREHAAGALGEIDDRRALKPLMEALQKPALRRGAATALGRMRAHEATKALEAIAPRVKAARWALSQVAIPTTASEAIEDLREGQLRLIVRKLRSLPDAMRRRVETQIVRRFSDALDAGDEDLRWYVTALMSFQHAEAPALLTRTLEESWRRMGSTVGYRRKAACCGCLHHRTLRALKANPSPDAVPNLVATVTNRYQRHAAMAMQRLHELDGGGLSDRQIAGMLQRSAAIRDPIGSVNAHTHAFTRLIRFAGEYGGSACRRKLVGLRRRFRTGRLTEAVEAALRSIDRRTAQTAARQSP